jgi:hypothetical protein
VRRSKRRSARRSKRNKIIRKQFYGGSSGSLSLLNDGLLDSDISSDGLLDSDISSDGGDNYSENKHIFKSNKYDYPLIEHFKNEFNRLIKELGEDKLIQFKGKYGSFLDKLITYIRKTNNDYTVSVPEDIYENEIELFNEINEKAPAHVKPIQSPNTPGFEKMVATNFILDILLEHPIINRYGELLENYGLKSFYYNDEDGFLDKFRHEILQSIAASADNSNPFSSSEITPSNGLIKEILSESESGYTEGKGITLEKLNEVQEKYKTDIENNKKIREELKKIDEIFKYLSQYLRTRSRPRREGVADLFEGINSSEVGSPSSDDTPTKSASALKADGNQGDTWATRVYSPINIGDKQDVGSLNSGNEQNVGPLNSDDGQVVGTLNIDRFSLDDNRQKGPNAILDELRSAQSAAKLASTAALEAAREASAAKITVTEQAEAMKRMEEEMETMRSINTAMSTAMPTVMPTAMSTVMPTAMRMAHRRRNSEKGKDAGHNHLENVTREPLHSAKDFSKKVTGSNINPLEPLGELGELNLRGFKERK